MFEVQFTFDLGKHYLKNESISCITLKMCMVTYALSQGEGILKIIWNFENNLKLWKIIYVWNLIYF